MTDTTQIKLAIAIMAYGGQITSHQAAMWINMGVACTAVQKQMRLIYVQTWDINPVDKARNVALASAMATGADWLLMVDADAFVIRCVDVLSSNAGVAITRMILNAAGVGYDIVVAPVRSRDQTEHVMAYDWTQERPLDLETPHGLVPIDSASAAIMAINLHSVGDAQFRFVQGTETQRGMSEDHAFCQQMRAAGKRIACDTRVVTGHVGRPQPIYSR